MTIILTLLSLLSAECRVHRVPNAYEGCTFNLAGPALCQDPSHWLPCTVVEKCDTVWQGGDNMMYQPPSIGESRWICAEIRCYPETTLVDSGGIAGVGDDTTRVTLHGPAGPTVYVLDSIAGLDLRWLKEATPDLKEMLREWRVEKCYKAAYNAWPNLWISQDITDHWRDSCECVYQNGGSK